MNDFRKKLGAEPFLADRFAEKAGEPHDRNKLAIEGIQLRGKAAVIAILAPAQCPDLNTNEEQVLRMTRRISPRDEAELPFQDSTGRLREMEALLLQRGEVARIKGDNGPKMH